MPRRCLSAACGLTEGVDVGAEGAWLALQHLRRAPAAGAAPAGAQVREAAASTASGAPAAGPQPPQALQLVNLNATDACRAAATAPPSPPQQCVSSHHANVPTPPFARKLVSHRYAQPHLRPGGGPRWHALTGAGSQREGNTYSSTPLPATHVAKLCAQITSQHDVASLRRRGGDEGVSGMHRWDRSASSARNQASAAGPNTAGHPCCDALHPCVSKPWACAVL